MHSAQLPLFAAELPGAVICGVDEAGRGPLAGAVFAAAVVLDSARPILGLNDSKKLSEKKRDELAVLIKERALGWAVARSEVEEIDRLNILQASLLAMRRAVEALPLTPSEVLVDGNRCPMLALPVRAIVGGDGSVAQIAAASILAKTARDADMLLLHEIYPAYGFDRHKGYPTADHMNKLAQHGVSPVHRRSFAPVKKLLKQTKQE